jgi:PAS domain S-box-containing protein
MNSDGPAKFQTPPSDELLRLIFESAKDFAIFSIDLAGLVTSWNAGAQRLLGYKEEEILGKTADVIFPPDDLEAGAQERAAAALNGRAEDERWQIRKDRSRFWASGLLMRLAEPAQGFVKILQDQTDRHQWEASLRASEERFRLLATNIPQLVFVGRVDGSRTWPSPQWIDFTGLGFEASLGLGWLDGVHPDDRDATIQAWAHARQSGQYYVEHRIRQGTEGAYRWHQTRARPIEGQDKLTADWIGTMTDIDDLRGLQGRQQVILAELQHRTRNLLALVQGIARQTSRTSDDPKTFVAKFNDRLQALSRVQAVVGEGKGKPVPLRDLLTSELQAQIGEGKTVGAKVILEGPEITLPPASGQALGLAIHELATNAAKYGAFRQDAAKLAILWSVTTASAEPWLELQWNETGVDMPTIAAPSRRGYGSELIERALPYQLGARTQLQFASDGVRCTIAVPVERDQVAEVHGDLR